MGRTQLHRKLAALTNQSADDFIRHMRLQRAKDLLTQNAGTVSEIARALENESVPALNATRFLRKHRDTELCLEDAHPNALAHTLIADTLAAFLIANGFLPPAPARVVGTPELPDSSHSP